MNEFYYAVSDNIEGSHISYNESQHLHKPKVEVYSHNIYELHCL